MNTFPTHVAIVGAGPYGLSLAAHLREAGVPFRIFGRPMKTWATEMPLGMMLKSDGFASNLSAGRHPFTLEDFCRETGRPYDHTSTPVPLETFVAYGEEFQRRCVPTLDPRQVTGVEQRGHLFRVTLDDGEAFEAQQVVLAVGVSSFEHVPKYLANLPAGSVSHTSGLQTFDRFRGMDVAVLGRGASSLNAAALLGEEGANVTLLSRRPKIHIHQSIAQSRRSLYQKLRHPSSMLGSSLRSWLWTKAPGLYHALPSTVRRIVSYKHLGPSGGKTLAGRIEGKMTILGGWAIQSAAALPADDSAAAPRLRLTLSNGSGETRDLLTDHIVAGTGFRYDMRRLRFLSASILDRLETQTTGAPILSRAFQSTVPGIYFTGPTAASSFGPLLRFVAGAEYAAIRLTAQLNQTRKRKQAGLPLPIPTSLKTQTQSGPHIIRRN